MKYRIKCVWFEIRLFFKGMAMGYDVVYRNGFEESGCPRWIAYLLITFTIPINLGLLLFGYLVGSKAMLDVMEESLEEYYDLDEVTEDLERKVGL